MADGGNCNGFAVQNGCVLDKNVACVNLAAVFGGDFVNRVIGFAGKSSLGGEKRMSAIKLGLYFVAYGVVIRSCFGNGGCVIRVVKLIKVSVERING